MNIRVKWEIDVLERVTLSPNKKEIALEAAKCVYNKYFNITGCKWLYDVEIDGDIFKIDLETNEVINQDKTMTNAVLKTTNKFNHARLPAWPTLTEPERYWAGYLARKADVSGWVKEWFYGSAIFLEHLDFHNDGELRKEVFCCEAILTALTHREPKIAFRALLQATGYLADMSGVTSYYYDSFRVAKERVERFLEGL